jgi:hypothetical protein
MDEESKQLLKAFEEEIKQEILEPKPVENDEELVEKNEPVVDWKKKHDELMEKFNVVSDKKDEFDRLLAKQMGMMRYMCEGAEKIGMKFDEMHMIGGDSGNN